MPTRVELDLFSGRPNPCWELTVDEATELAGRVADLPSASKLPAPGALGYRGIVVSSTDQQAGLPSRMRVYRGMVVVEGAKQALHYRDTKHIERWLLDNARRRGYAAIVDELIKSIP